MSETSAQPLPLHDYLTEIRDRFEHPAVLDPYQRNPFLTREDIPYPPLHSASASLARCGSSARASPA